MSDTNQGKPGLSIQEIRNRSGMMDGTQEDVSTVLPPDELPADETGKVDLTEKHTVTPAKEEPSAKKPDAKSETKSEEDEDTEDDEGAEDDEIDDDEIESKSSTKPSRPLKTAFKQIGDLRRGQNALAEGLTSLAEAIKGLKASPTAEAKAETKATVTDLIAKAKEAGADAEWLETFAKTITSDIEGKFKGEIEKLTEKLTATEQTAQELKEAREKSQRVRAESNTFSDEWSEILPALTKQYPNASPQLLTEAREVMKTLAVSKDYGGESLDGKENVGKVPMPLDYILFKEKGKFDTILNVKKGNSGEKASGEPQIEESEEEKEVDLDPSQMTPDKWKEHMKQKQKRAGQSDEIEIVMPHGRS